MSIQFLKNYKNEQVEGKSITLNDSSSLPFVDIEVEGDTEQETREGYNKFNINTFSPRGNGGVTNLKKDTSNNTIEFDNGISGSSGFYGDAGYDTSKTYSIRAIATINYTGNLSIRFGASSSTPFKTYSVKSGVPFDVFSEGFIPNSSSIVFYINTQEGFEAGQLHITLSKIQITEGTTNREYEEYGAMPSPDYPSDIQVVTGDVEVEVVGKNILQLENTTVSNRGITGIITKNNILAYEGTATALYADITKTTTKKIPAGTYTFSIDAPRETERIVLYLSGGETARIIINAGETSKTITLTEEKIAYRVGITGMTSGNSYSGTVKMQLEKNSTATEYEPCQGQTQTLSLGSISIYDEGVISEEGNDWYVTNKYIKKRINVAPTSINTSSDNTVRLTFSNIFENACLNDSTNKCNRLQNVNVWSNDIEGFYVSNSYNIIARMNKATVGTTSASILSYLQENETYVVCKLETPIKEKITDQTLISQLNKLKELHTYKNITNITTNTEGLKPILKATYKKELQKMKQFI